MVSRIIFLFLFFPLTGIGQNLEFIKSEIITTPGEYIVPEGEVWKLKCVIGKPTSVMITHCTQIDWGLVNPVEELYNLDYAITGSVFSINNLMMGNHSFEYTATHVPVDFNCNSFPAILDNIDLEEYVFSDEIILGSTDLVNLYSSGILINILKFSKN